MVQTMVLKLIKILGFCPIYETPGIKCYFVPLIMFSLNLSGAVNKLYHMIEDGKADAAYGSFDSILHYLMVILLEISFVVIYQTTARKVESWNALLGVIKFYPKNRTSMINKIIFLVSNIVYLLGIILEGYHKRPKNIQNKISWLYMQVIIYFTNIMIYVAIQFLVVIRIFYKRTSDILTNIYRAISEEKATDIRKNHISRNMIKRMSLRYLQYYNLMENFNDVFGWPLCYLIMSFVLKFLINAQELFFEDTSHRGLGLSNFVEIILPTVS